MGDNLILIRLEILEEEVTELIKPLKRMLDQIVLLKEEVEDLKCKGE